MSDPLYGLVSTLKQFHQKPEQDAYILANEKEVIEAFVNHNKPGLTIRDVIDILASESYKCNVANSTGRMIYKILTDHRNRKEDTGEKSLFELITQLKTLERQSLRESFILENKKLVRDAFKNHDPANLTAGGIQGILFHPHKCRITNSTAILIHDILKKLARKAA